MSVDPGRLNSSMKYHPFYSHRVSNSEDIRQDYR